MELNGIPIRPQRARSVGAAPRARSLPSSIPNLREKRRAPPRSTPLRSLFTPPSRLDCVELCFSNLLYSRLICGRSEVSNCFGRVINNQVRISLYGGSIQRLHLPFFL